MPRTDAHGSAVGVAFVVVALAAVDDIVVATMRLAVVAAFAISEATTHATAFASVVASVVATAATNSCVVVVETDTVPPIVASVATT